MLFALQMRPANRMKMFNTIAAPVTLAALAILLACGLPSVARADVTLFNEGGWRVDGVEDLTLGPNVFGSITVSTNGVAAGQFTELKIFFDLGTNGVAQIYS